MPGFTEQMTQELALLDTINSQTSSNNNINSGSPAPIDMSKVKRAFYILAIESVASGVISAQLQSAQNSNFNAGVHNITGTNSGNFNTNNQVATFEVRADQVASANANDRYVRLAVTTNGNTTFYALGLGGQAEQRPAGANYNFNSTFLAGQFVANT